MEIIKMREHAEMAGKAAEWFHSKWGIPAEEYEASIKECLKNKESVPQWYAAVENGEILGGIGIIENDFHNRKDLAPNVCALYVEKEYRGKGIAGKLLQFVCNDMYNMGIAVLYLVTDHTSFYERYGWQFLCMVQENGGSGLIRMYIHQMGDKQEILGAIERPNAAEN